MKNIDDYFVVIYNDGIEVFLKERLNDFLFKDGCLVCDLKTAREYKKYHKLYVMVDEQWIRDYFGSSKSLEEERNFEKDLFYSQNRFS